MQIAVVDAAQRYCVGGKMQTCLADLVNLMICLDMPRGTTVRLPEGQLDCAKRKAALLGRWATIGRRASDAPFIGGRYVRRKQVPRRPYVGSSRAGAGGKRLQERRVLGCHGLECPPTTT